MTTSDHSRRASRRRLARDSLALASGTAITGLLSYVFFAVVTQSLGADGAAPVSVLWSYWAVAAAVLTFSVQHWIIATLAADGHEATVALLLPRIAVWGGLLSLVAGSVAYAARSTLFGGGGAAFPVLLAVLTAGSLLTGVVRGALAGRRRYVATAVSLVLENVVRVAGAVAAALTGAGAVAFGLSLAVGSLTGLLFFNALHFGRAGLPSDAPRPRSPLVLMSGIAGGSLLAQVLLTGGPVALAAVGGSPADVTSVFIALAVWRAPYLVALGISSQLTTWMADLVTRGAQDALARLRATTLMATVATAGLAALLALAVMPQLLRAVFGTDIVLSSGTLVGLGVGTAMALGSLVLLLLLLALGRPKAASISWTVALAVACGWLVSGLGDPVDRVVLAFLSAQGTAFVLLFLSAAPSKEAGLDRPGGSAD